MFIYNGKFNWYKTAASNETITFVFPAGLALGDPVSAFWQWSSDPSGTVNKKASVASSGIVNSIVTGNGYSRIHISFGYYIFDGSVTDDYKTLTLTMSNPAGDTSSGFHLAATHINPVTIRSTVVFTGALEWPLHAKGEMTTLVVPYGVTEGAFFGLYHQWTVDAHGVKKANAPINGVFQDVKYAADGTITASFKGGDYTHQFTFNGKAASWVLSNPQGEKSQVNKLAIAYLDS